LLVELWIVLLQKASVDLSVPLVDNLNDSNPLLLVVRTVVTPRAVIYAAWFGAEFVWTEPVFLHVGLTVNIVDGQMFAADKTQVLAADTANNELCAFTGCGIWNGAVWYVVVAWRAA
jgi:hypothetical protein